ncbi:MAG: methyltransferase domain-containing protein [Thermodesulfobacteriota bacterium]|nr:methyltransferase domain-containing protein [Thermodesulfobacteriota bacterium]
MTVKKIFDAGALQYDRNRRKVIPCFDDFYKTLIRLIPFHRDEKFTALDLGAGTGLVTALIFNVFPQAAVSLVDISQKMLEKAKKRFAGKDNVVFHIMDYNTSPLPGKYDLVVSAMSIHHLKNPDKKRLFQKIYHALIPGGAFIHAELARGGTDDIEKIYQKQWRKHLGGTDLTEDELNVIYERMSYDIPAPLDMQLEWMRDAGFINVDCFYKYFNFVVYAGCKKTA